MTSANVARGKVDTNIDGGSIGVMLGKIGSPSSITDTVKGRF